MRLKDFLFENESYPETAELNKAVRAAENIKSITYNELRVEMYWGFFWHPKTNSFLIPVEGTQYTHNDYGGDGNESISFYAYVQNGVFREIVGWNVHPFINDFYSVADMHNDEEARKNLRDRIGKWIQLEFKD